ncbi:MAG: hypothetical protein CBARDMAM_4483 [uncultured Caballeronia sp.]|nr:MAG: hypothetical protein CBARDMAM_4483 [uncultured Caballeronia sp.]
MKSRALGTLSLPGIVAAAASLIAGVSAVTTEQAQTARPIDSASMVTPAPGASDSPKAPNASGSRAYNPDNMPMKRPALPANGDRMLHNNPASDVIAK